MAKEQSLYDKMKEALIDVQRYEQGLGEAKKAAQTSDAAIKAAGRKSPEAARALGQADNSRHNLNFLVAGFEDSKQGFEKDFLKNRGNLEAILGDKKVGSVAKDALFAYNPSVRKGFAKKYSAAAKLHEELTPMLENLGKYNNETLSKKNDDSIFADMAQDVIADYVQNETDPLYLRAFVELAGGVVKTDKDGKMQIVQNKDGSIAIGSNSAVNKNFVVQRYDALIKEKKKKFFELVGDDIPGYVAATLPDSYDDARGFYSTVVGMINEKEEKKKKK